jgi:hypothetical protein
VSLRFAYQLPSVAAILPTAAIKLLIVDLKLQRKATKLCTNVDKLSTYHHRGTSFQILGPPTACAHGHIDSGAISSDDL